MLRFLAFYLGLFLVLLPFASTSNAEGMNIEDLLTPEVPSINEKIEANQKLEKKTKDEMNIDELLGPKDNFPFRPDNHRDSGTGKFNSF